MLQELLKRVGVGILPLIGKGLIALGLVSVVVYGVKTIKRVGALETENANLQETIRVNNALLTIRDITIANDEEQARKDRERLTQLERQQQDSQEFWSKAMQACFEGQTSQEFLKLWNRK